jgi:putative membrane protein
MPRLFIYHIEAQESEEPARSILSGQFKLMSKRLWLIITWPSAILCTLFAIGLLALMPEWLSQGWMHVKLTFVLLLFAYHLKTHQIYKELQRDHFRYSSKFMRLFNEGSTLILFAVVFLVILKSALNWIFATVGFFVLAGMLMMGIKIYKRIRDKNPEA